MKTILGLLEGQHYYDYACKYSEEGGMKEAGIKVCCCG